MTSALGLLIGCTAMVYQLISGQSFTQVLFSGQDALPELVANAADYSVAVMILLIVCKALAYGLSLSAFRGGPVFPSMFIGAAIGIAASGLPGMNLAAGIGMGIGAMCTAMLRLPLTSTLLAVVLMGVDGVIVTPQVVVAVVVAFVITIVPPGSRSSRRQSLLRLPQHVPSRPHISAQTASPDDARKPLQHPEHAADDEQDPARRVPPGSPAC